MNKKLPGIFANKDLRNVNNNTKVYYSYQKKEETPRSLIGKSVLQKINTIFSSNNYIYKVDVVITLNDKKITKKIIGKTKTQLITMDNELIPINDIIDIDYKK